VSADEQRDPPSTARHRSDPETNAAESFRSRRESRADHSPADGAAGDDTHTRIIRREPTGPIPTPLSDDTKTSIIRRQPSEPILERADAPRTTVVATAADDARTTFVPKAAAHEPATGIIGRAQGRIAAATPRPRPGTAMAAGVFNIVNGWATAVIATDLITGWWKTDRLFCIGVGFLTAVCGASIIAGVFQLLLRRRVGVYLTLVGAVLAVLIFAGIFVTGARVSGVVRAMPALPAAAALFALLPSTRRWTQR
jgi:uncharacterized membrane protein YeaQ/YmgE (transglycosylase-associated protein family)